MEVKVASVFTKGPGKQPVDDPHFPFLHLNPRDQYKPDLIQREAEEGSLIAGGREGIYGVCPLPEPKLCIVGPVLGLRAFFILEGFFFFNFVNK